MRKTARTTITMGAGAALVAISLASLVLLRPHPQEETAEPEQAQAEAPADTEDDAEPEETVDEQRETYIATWAERINAFNAGYPLEGYGSTFAAAAYDYGIDPRYSPAIARVESGSGQNCFYSCNAWGWGTQSWSDWDSAIYGHVAGLASSYDSTLTWGAALSYNEENPDGWYAEVEASMAAIWPTDSL